MLKFERIGYHKLVDQLSGEIQNRRVKRSQAVFACNSQANYPPSIGIFKWFDVSESGKKWCIDNHLKKELDALLSYENCTTRG